MNISYALVLISALGFAGATLADDAVKSGYPEGKAGRALDGDTVKSGGRKEKFGRAVDGESAGSVDKRETAKSDYPAAKPGRRIE